MRGVGEPESLFPHFVLCCYPVDRRRSSMSLFRRRLAAFPVLPSCALRWERPQNIDGTRVGAICQKTRWQFPAMRLRRGCWLLLVALATLAPGAMDASADDLSAGAKHTCALHDNGVTCWGTGSAIAPPPGLTNPSAVA